MRQGSARRRLVIRSTLSGIALCTLTGCLVGPDYRRPSTNMPGKWVTSLKTNDVPATQASVVTPDRQADLTRWWSHFHDPVLDSLIDRAIRANLDIRAARSRLVQARAARRGTAAGLFPSAGLGGGFTRSATGNSGPAPSTTNLFQAGFDASWEIDFFGGQRRSIEQAEADVQTAVEDRRDVLVTILAEVATGYLSLRGYQREITIARENLTAQMRTADITRRRFKAGFDDPLDVANADASVAGTRAAIPVLEQLSQQTIYGLSVLVGEAPGELLAELSREAPIPPNPPEVPIGLPSDLLRRRPDIRRAEAILHSATARVGVAMADLFPRFSLTGSATLRSAQLGSLFGTSGQGWSFGPTVSWPILDFGAVRSNIGVQTAVQEQALLGYQQTVLQALRDVESSLVAYGKEQEHRVALTEAVAANKRATDVATRLYSNGNTDFLNVVTAQRSLYAAQTALVQSDRTIATNLVALYKALGGGWEAVDQ